MTNTPPTTGSNVPRFLYGTAWKELTTQSLTELAIQQGFRGIDTANQRKHYFEAAVGAAIATCIEQGLVTRDDLFLQTKFTFRHGQDQRLPYNPEAPINTQVAQSFASSLQHLGTDRIDSYVLHGPSRSTGLGVDDMLFLDDSGDAIANVGTVTSTSVTGLGITNGSINYADVDKAGLEMWLGSAADMLNISGTAALSTVNIHTM